MENMTEANQISNIGAWFNRQNHTDFILIFNPAEQAPEGYVRAQPLHGVAYQTFDEGSGAWAADPNSETLERIAACKAELAAIDREAGAGRAVRGLALAAAESAGVEGEDFNKLQEFESRAESLREEIAEWVRQIGEV
jgi:hypothetical protein